MIEDSLLTLAPYLQGAFAASCLAAVAYLVWNMIAGGRKSRGDDDSR